MTWSFDVFFDFAWIYGSVNNVEAGDLRCYHTHYDIIVMMHKISTLLCLIMVRYQVILLMFFIHDDIIKWKTLPCYWPFVKGIHDQQWIPLTKVSDVELWCFLWTAPEWMAKQSRRSWFEMPWYSLWCHSNDRTDPFEAKQLWRIWVNISHGSTRINLTCLIPWYNKAQQKHCMMTSSNGNIFPVTGPLSPVPGEFPAQRPVTRSFDIFFDLHFNKP